MGRRKSFEERSLLELRRLTAICRTCGARHHIGRSQVLGMYDGGVSTFGNLKRRSFCVLCRHAEEIATDLRFHAEWMDDPPGPAIRIVRPVQFRSAA